MNKNKKHEFQCLTFKMKFHNLPPKLCLHRDLRQPVAVSNTNKDDWKDLLSTNLDNIYTDLGFQKNKSLFF